MKTRKIRMVESQVGEVNRTEVLASVTHIQARIRNSLNYIGELIGELPQEPTRDKYITWLNDVEDAIESIDTNTRKHLKKLSDIRSTLIANLHKQ